jgi:hypothetical protein
MVQFSQMFDFAQRHTFVPRRELLFHLFDCYNFVGLLVDRLDDGAVSSIANIFDYCEFVHDR